MGLLFSLPLVDASHISGTSTYTLPHSQRIPAARPAVLMRLLTNDPHCVFLEQFLAGTTSIVRYTRAAPMRQAYKTRELLVQ